MTCGSPAARVGAAAASTSLRNGLTSWQECPAACWARPWASGQSPSTAAPCGARFWRSWRRRGSRHRVPSPPARWPRLHRDASCPPRCALFAFLRRPEPTKRACRIPRSTQASASQICVCLLCACRARCALARSSTTTRPSSHRPWRSTRWRSRPCRSAPRSGTPRWPGSSPTVSRGRHGSKARAASRAWRAAARLTWPVRRRCACCASLS